jgi:hypothetical protein
MTKIRVLSSCLIAILALSLGAWLLHDDTPVPWIWWLLGVLAIAGVTGADVVASVAAVWNKPQGGEK